MNADNYFDGCQFLFDFLKQKFIIKTKVHNDGEV